MPSRPLQHFSRVLLLLLALATGTAAAQAPVNRGAPEPIQPISGSLVIVGGGGTTYAIWQRFRQLAGGDTARIVLVPTAAAEVDTVNPESETRYYSDTLGVKVVMLHTRSRDVANSDSFIAPLRKATGIWFVGGVQSRITDAYLGTKTEREFHAVLARGGVIGGTSAGAAIMTKVMITGQRVVNGDTVANVGEGFGFLPGAVADQHFLARRRQNRLVGVLKDHPGLVGFGVDERTALVVHSGRQIEVVGASEVRIIQSANSWQELSVQSLKAPATADLIALSREAQARAQPRIPPP